MTDSDDAPGSSAPEASGRRETLPGVRGRGPAPKRIPMPWWAVTLLGAGVGFLTAEWIGAVFGGLLGFFAWKLR